MPATVLRRITTSAWHSAMMPIWAAQVLTTAKSFVDNPVIGSPALNQRGLHTGRMALAHRLAQSRRRRLAHLMEPADQAAFDRDGFLVKRDFLPAAHFDALRSQVQSFSGGMREMVQGNAVTRRVALSPEVLARMPAAAQLLDLPQWRGPLRYAASYDSEPINYIQTILTHATEGPDDPQCALHADTFHPTVKAWLFLTDVPEDEGPFTYVAGSHRFTPQRRAWEHRKSLEMAQQSDRLTQRGSFRVQANELAALGLPQPTALAVPANTLVVADTHGFHARGQSVRATRRVEVWASGRRNPFLPWTGLDVWTIPALGRRRMPVFWKYRDMMAAWQGRQNLWRERKDVAPFDAA